MQATKTISPRRWESRFFPSNAFIAFARSLHTFNRSKKMNCKLLCMAVCPSIASKALIMTNTQSSKQSHQTQNKSKKANKQTKHNNTKNQTRHREVGSLPALRNEMHDDILCVIMSMARKRSKTKTTRKTQGAIQEGERSNKGQCGNRGSPQPGS